MLHPASGAMESVQTFVVKSEPVEVSVEESEPVPNTSGFTTSVFHKGDIVFHNVPIIDSENYSRKQELADTLEQYKKLLKSKIMTSSNVSGAMESAQAFVVKSEPVDAPVVESEPVPSTSGFTMSVFHKGDMVLQNVPIIDCESYARKQELADALEHCKNLLKSKNLISSNVSGTFSERSKCIGQEMFNRMMEMLNETRYAVEEELDHNSENIDEEVTELEDSQDSDESYSPPSESEKAKPSDVPLEMKIKAVKMAELHPKWSIKTLASVTTRKLRRKRQLEIWKQQVESGGSRKDKLNLINSWVYNRFSKALHDLNPVTTQMLQKWAMDAAFQYGMDETSFTASPTWAKRLKSKFMTQQRGGT